MVDLLITLAIIVIVIMALWFLLGKLQLPEPAKQIISVVLVIVVAVVAIGFLMQFGGHALRIR